MASGRQVCCSRSTSAGLAEESTDCTSPRMFSRSISCPLMLIPLNPAKSMPHRRVRRTLGVPRHPPGHRSSLESEPHLLKFRRTVQRPSERLCLQLRGAKSTAISLQSLCRVRIESCDSDTVLTFTMPNFCLSYKHAKVPRLLDTIESTVSRAPFEQNAPRSCQRTAGIGAEVAARGPHRSVGQ